jgi:NAD(P)H dehydrogenase (quinone)
MKIGVTGATGQLGTLVIKELKKRIPNDEIVALVRSPEKASNLGVETRKFDYSNRDGLTESLKGIDRLLLISSNEIGQRAKQHLNVIEAAWKNGVKWIVYTSLLRADNSSLSLAAEHHTTEQAIIDSGIDYTILRNGWYTENYANTIKGAVDGGAYIGSASNGRISSASRADYAEAAAVVITNESHKGKIYELAGDDSYTLHDLAAEVSKQSGKKIPYKNLTEGEYIEALKSFNVPGPLAEAIAGWDVSASNDDLYDDSHQLSLIIGRPTTPLSESVREALK